MQCEQTFPGSGRQTAQEEERGEEMKRVPSDQHDGENAFGRPCARLRQRMSLTQRALGRLLSISEQAIQH